MEKLQQTNNKTSKKRRMEMGKERSKHEDNRKKTTKRIAAQENIKKEANAGEQENRYTQNTIQAMLFFFKL